MPLKTVPREEIDHVRLIGQNLSDLERYVASFADALSLHRFCESRGGQLRGWQRVAGRDASLTVFHFGKTMQGVGEAFKGCPTFRTLVDHTQLRGSRRMFEKTFPDYIAIRNAVAHAGELYATLEKREANMARSVNSHGIEVDESSRLAIGDAFAGDSFLQNINGQMVALELSEASLQALATTAKQFISGFPATPHEMFFVL